jgi:calcium-dependent protein kinase
VLLCGYPPFYGENEREILMEIKHGSLQFDGEEWSQIEQPVKDFIAHMISPMKIRWNAKELLDYELI